MLARDFRQGVAHRLQKVLIGRYDGAIQLEFDHGLRSADRLDLT